MAKFVEKAALAAGVASLGAAPLGAGAAVVNVTGSPLSVRFWDGTPIAGGLIDQAPWDVDGDGTTDFTIVGVVGGAASGTGTYGGTNTIFLRGFNGIFGGVVNAFGGPDFNNNKLGVIGTTSQPIQRVPGSNSIGVTGGAYFPAGSIGFVSNVPFVRAYSSGGGTNTIINTAAVSYAPGTPGFIDIGFSFDINGNTHFGTALIQGTGGSGSPDWTLTVHRWSYEDTPDTPIHVFVPTPEPEPEPPPRVPVPASIVPMVTLLGLGAAGLRRMRKQKEAQAAV